MENKPEKIATESKFENVVNLIISLVSVGFSVAIIFFIYSTYNSPLKVNEIGQIGDFFGGILNPLLTFITVALLIWSIRFQMDELKATREELKRSAESHKELVTQGNVNFFIEQSISSFKESESEIQAILSMRLFLDGGGSMNNPGAPSIDLYEYRDEGLGNPIPPRFYNLPVEYNNESLRSGKLPVYADERNLKLIIELYRHVKHELINLNVLLQNNGWSHALFCFSKLKDNISILRYFELDAHKEIFIVDLIENAVRTIEDDIASIERDERQQSINFLLKDLLSASVELKVLARNRPF